MSKYYMGIDVSKGYADFVMLDSRKQSVEPNFQLDDTFEGHHKLYSYLRQFFKKHPEATVYCAVESTGGYENNWFYSLNKYQEHFSLQIARINPRGICHHNQADLKRIITDEISARVIAEYMINYPKKASYQSTDYFYAARRKWKFIRSLTKQQTQFSNQLESLVYNSMPEILSYCKQGFPQWVLKLLKAFPSASQLAQASIDEVSAIPYISRQRAAKLIEKAKTSVASADDLFTLDTIRRTTEEIIRLESIIKEQVGLIVQHCPFPEIGLLKTFIGIGDSSAIGLLIQIGAVERFYSSKHFASFFGVHPAFKKSGDGLWAHRMSKAGSPEVRAILYMVALNAIVSNPLIRQTYHENLKKGKTKMDAIGVCMHKILRIVYGMLKNRQPFNPEIDFRNRERSLSKKKAKTKDNNRRFQEPDENAPISGRQSRKRKEQELSQNGNTIMHEINVPALSQE